MILNEQTTESNQIEEIFINKISVISYNSVSYNQTKVSQVYSMNNENLVQANKLIDYQSPPWIYENKIDISKLSGWYFSGSDTLAYNIDTDKLSTWINTQKSFYLSAFTSNSKLKSIYKENYKISSNLFQHGLVALNVLTPSGSFIQFLSSFIENENIQDNIKYKQQTIFATIQDFNYSSSLHNIVQANINTELSFFDFKIKFKGTLYCQLDTNYKTKVIDVINYEPKLHKQYEIPKSGEFLSGILSGDMNYNTGLIFKIKNIKGIIINYQSLPDELKYFIQIKNTNNIYGWLYGGSDLYFTEYFYYNQISSFINSKVFKSGKVFNLKSDATIYDQFESKIAVSVYGNILEGNVWKNKNSNKLQGFLNGKFKYKNFQLNVYANVYGYTDSYSLKRVILAAGQIGKSLDITWLSGKFFNSESISDTEHKIIDIKENNTLGRKNLTTYNSLNGQNLNTASKNFDINNQPYMIQTWKIIQYETSNTNNSTYQPQLNSNSIDLKTYINSSQTVRNKLKIVDLLYKQPLVFKTDPEQSGNFYLYWNEKNNLNNIQIILANDKVKEYISSYLFFSGPYDTLKSAETFLKKFVTIKNLKLSNIQKLPSSYFEYENTSGYLYSFEHTNLEV